MFKSRSRVRGGGAGNNLSDFPPPRKMKVACLRLLKDFRLLDYY